jgi:hypothetical protein
MPSRIRTKRVFAKAAKGIRKCWALLEPIKRLEIGPTFFNEIHTFQITLAESFHELSKLRVSCRAEEKKWVGSKSANNSTLPAGVLKRLRRLGKNLQLIDDLIAIGKALGDGLVWMFYHREKAMLLKHEQHQACDYVPFGIGGIGELEFIRRNAVMGEHFVLYHGITNLLRYGDISLVNVRTFEVVAIAELKTRLIQEHGDQLELGISCTFVSNRRLSFVQNWTPLNSDSKMDVVPEDTISFDQNIKRNLQRQIDEIGRSCFSPANSKEEGLSLSLDVKTYCSELDTLCSLAQSEKALHRKCGKGLVLTVLRNRGRSLLSRLKPSREDLQSKLGGIEELVRATIAPETSDGNFNSITVGHLGPRGINGASPLFWWPIQSETLKAVLFREIIAITSFNPAWLLMGLVNRGFSVTTVQHRQHKHRVTRRIGDAKLEL